MTDLASDDPVTHLSTEELAAGLGDAVIEITDKPHTGCAKFSQRFGLDAARFVNSPDGKGVRLRGLCATVVQPGVIRRGDGVTKV
jgi:MOSC domain-containing protein YiiM